MSYEYDDGALFKKTRLLFATGTRTYMISDSLRRLQTVSLDVTSPGKHYSVPPL